MTLLTLHLYRERCERFDSLKIRIVRDNNNSLGEMIKMKKTLLMATGALLAAGFASSDAKAVDVELYGQVNKTLMQTDNGTTSEFGVRDNDKSSTRVGLKGQQALDNGLTASVLVEYELNGDDTRTKSGTAINSGAASTVTERHARVGLSGMFGTVMVGHTSVATDGATEQDMAGVSDLLGSDIARFGGNTTFGGAITAGTEAQDVYTRFDGDRADVVAYHTPVIAGVQGRLSTSEGGEIQAAAFYKGKYDAFAVKAAAGYESNSTNGVDHTITGSVSVKHDSGLAGTYAYGTQSTENGTSEADMHYVKVGYAFDALEVAADYASHDTDNGVNLEGKAYGVGVQYDLGHGVSVAGAYRQLEAEDNAGDADEIDLIMANVRVKF